MKQEKHLIFTIRPKRLVEGYKARNGDHVDQRLQIAQIDVCAVSSWKLLGLLSAALGSDCKCNWNASFGAMAWKRHLSVH